MVHCVVITLVTLFQYSMYFDYLVVDNRRFALDACVFVVIWLGAQCVLLTAAKYVHLCVMRRRAVQEKDAEAQRTGLHVQGGSTGDDAHETGARAQRVSGASARSSTDSRVYYYFEHDTERDARSSRTPRADAANGAGHTTARPICADCAHAIAAGASTNPDIRAYRTTHSYIRRV